MLNGVFDFPFQVHRFCPLEHGKCIGSFIIQWNNNGIDHALRHYRKKLVGFAEIFSTMSAGTILIDINEELVHLS